jgi:hypothetical protein
MAMSHPNHPNGNYEMANLVEVFGQPHAISSKPAYDLGDGVLRFAGWIWRYDLAALRTSALSCPNIQQLLPSLCQLIADCLRVDARSALRGGTVGYGDTQ